jgi:hypothetical protein
LIIALSGFPQIGLGQNEPFVPANYKVPDTLKSEYFRIRMLTVNDVVKDYDAIISSIEHLKKMFPTSTWPS